MWYCFQCLYCARVGLAGAGLASSELCSILEEDSVGHDESRCDNVDCHGGVGPTER